MATVLSFIMWGIAGISILLVLFFVIGSFLTEKDKVDAYKYLAEKAREEKRKGH